MLRQQAQLVYHITAVIDFLTVLLAVYLAQFAAEKAGFVHDYREHIWVIPIIFVAWFFLFRLEGLHASIRRLRFRDILYRLLAVHFWGGIFIAALFFLVDKADFSRGLFGLFILISLLLFAMQKGLLRGALGFIRRRGYNTRNLLIVGTREKARHFHGLVEHHADWGLQVAGFLQVSDGPLQDQVEGHRVLGYVHDLVEVCKTYTVDEVVFCLSKDLMVDAEEYLRDLEELGITVRMVLDFYQVYQSRRELSFFHNELPILTFSSRSLDVNQLFMKRCLDVLGALVGLTITATLFPLIALAVRHDSPGPLFFCQERVGENGRRFKCWKFRSMYLDAEERKKGLMAQNEMKGAIFKIKDDPRITPGGKFLRKTSLDELPQFWNVLRGEMSLVGTRPPTPAEVAEYENWHRRRISIKPGVTGMWQVSGRNSIDDFDEIVRLDLKYIDSWSIWLDIRILLKTLKVVFVREGSC
ncbi:MAG: sugar transferase [Desulfuromonas sp.]|nr:MAG: sugar transferase [Desulfuromonas sp.]